MNHIEVMKLALDALEYWQKLCLDNGRASHELGRSTNAIAALRQAIQEAEKQEQWTPDDMAHRPGGLSMEDEPDLSEQGRNRSAVLVNNIQAMVDAGLPFLDALETTLKVYDHPTKPQEDMAYRPGGLSMEPNVYGDGNVYRGVRSKDSETKTLHYTAPVHPIDTSEKRVDETAKDEHEPDAYGDGNVYRGQRSKDSETKTLHYTEPLRNSWFKLTDAEVWDEWVRAVDESNRSNRELAFRFARAIEAKLKEKNT